MEKRSELAVLSPHIGMAPPSEFAGYRTLLAAAGTKGKREALLRFIVQNDLYFLAKVVLGYFWLTAPFHADFCRQVQKNINLSLFLLPHGYGKTKIFSIAGAIQAYLNRPTEPIAIICDTVDHAADKTREIKRHFESNHLLRALFPELVWENPFREAPVWTGEEFIMPKYDGRQEPSFMAASLSELPTGLHFPMILCDDIVNEKTCKTSEHMKASCRAYGMLRSSILQSGGTIRIVGTVCSDGDLHHLLSGPDTGYTVYRQEAIDPVTGAALWPEKLHLRKGDALREVA